MDYDLVVVGGGLAGSSLGMAMAQHGARVLILEKEAPFKDRVRGEGMLPWGTAEIRALGLYQPLLGSCARDVRWWTTPQDQRDLHHSPSGLGCLNFYHPEMQQRLLTLAAEAGCDVRRPAELMGVMPGQPPTVLVRSGRDDIHVTARLVVGADGRNSRVRAWSGLPARRDPNGLIIAGALFQEMNLPDNSIRITREPGARLKRRWFFPSGLDGTAHISFFATVCTPR